MRRIEQLHDREFLEARLHLTRRAIAEEIGCSVDGVALALRTLGLRMRPPARITPGTRYTRLVVLRATSARSGRDALWECQCDCGALVKAKTHMLLAGKTKSCGCLRRETAAAQVVALNTTHGLRGHPLYTTWVQMRQRCYNPNATSYKRYGAKGVTVCARWRGPDGFPHFLADVGERPGPEYTIDRIDPTGNYEPSNVRWADPLTQTLNTRARN